MFWLLKALCGTVSKRRVIIKRIHCDIACPVPVAGRTVLIFNFTGEIAIAAVRKKGKGNINQSISHSLNG